MTLRVRAASCFVALAVVACGGAEPKPPSVGEVKDFAAVCGKAHEGQRVAVVGYLRFPEKFSGDRSVMLRIYRAADFAGQPVGVQTMIGRQPNQAEAPPRQFADKDLKVRLADGQAAAFGTRVRVSGDLYYPSVGQDFQCALSNPLVERAN